MDMKAKILPNALSSTIAFPIFGESLNYRPINAPHACN
jgi:hypothetical protein